MKQLAFNQLTFTCKEELESLSLNPLKVMHITLVFPNSPAEKFGLLPGDFLGKVNGKDSVDLDFDQLYENEDQIRYEIHRPSECLTLTIEGSPSPVGILCEHTSGAIVSRCDAHDALPIELYHLWERSEWNNLLQASVNFLFKSDAAERFLRRFIHRSLMKELDETPAVLMQGVALFELGEKEKGMHMISQFEQERMYGWTTNWYALTYYYLGFDALQRGNHLEAFNLLTTSELYCNCQVLQARLQALNIEPSEKIADWEGSHFPLNFELDVLEQISKVNFNSLLACLGQSELLILCLMPGYRVNGPYSEVLTLYKQLVRHVPEFISPLYVITDTTEFAADKDWVLESEKQAVNDGYKINLLFDKNGTVAEALGQTTAPYLYLINKDGIILNADSEFQFDDIWYLLKQEFGREFK